MRTCLVLLVLAQVLLFSPSLQAGDYEIGELAGLNLIADVPGGWVAGPHKSPLPGMVSMKLTSEDGAESLVTITVMQPTSGASLSPGDREQLENLVSTVAKSIEPQSVEGALKVERFEHGLVKGAFFSATDKDPPPGEFRYMSQGMGWMQGLAVSFTALSNVDDAVARKVMFQVVGSVRPAGEAQGEARTSADQSGGF